MLTLLAALLVAPSGSVGPGPVAAPQSPPRSTQATLQITLNATDFLPGSPVKVQIQSSQDGYMVVFQVDGEGRVRVLFPLDPDLDAFVRGGKRYEVRGGGNHQSFLADDRPGSGIIYAAVSRQPLSFGQFAVNFHWDYDVLRLQREDSDVEAELTAFVSRMGDNVKFEYDLIGYRVYDPNAVVAAGNSGGFYDPYWSCLSCGWGYGGWGVSIGFGGWWPYYPYYPYYPYWGYDYPYYPCCGGGGGYYPPYPGNGPPIGGVVPLPPSVAHYGNRARSRNPTQPVPLDKAFQPDLTQSMRPASGSTTASRGTSAGTYAGTGRSRPRSGAASQQGSAPSGADRRESPTVGNTGEPSGRAAPSSAPPSSGATRGAAGSGFTDDRARRRPELSSDVMRRTSDAITTNRPAETSQPIFREPRREALTDRSRGSSQPQRPVYREPPRTTPTGQGSQGSQPMVTRSAPQSGARSAPQSGAPSRGGAAPQMGRSSGGPPSGGGGGGGGGGGAPSGGRARGRP